MAEGGFTIAKVLLVDDRQDNLVALEAMLQGLPVEPVAVSSGESALKRLLVDDFAVILMDAQMPGLDGFETAGHIKRRERTRHIPIIFLTAADRDARLALRGYAAGAVDYLTKPFDPWVLRAKVAIFVDLWVKTQQLRQQAQQWARLSGAAREAIRLLDGPHLGEQAERAREALRAALPHETDPMVRPTR
ncbi:response regulator [Catellatospora sp. NPDC049609]|uniref:response regulator n=1 Tax=Catellatospora sp. NPDC049609 TaxID=3155505 RepID=UPI003429DABB